MPPTNYTLDMEADFDVKRPSRALEERPRALEVKNMARVHH